MIRVNPSWIINLPLAPTARWVLVCMNDYGWPCWPSIDTLSRKCGVPRRSLERVLGMLRKGGVLKSSGNGKSLTWELVEVPPEVERKVVVEVRHRGADRRHRGASGAPPRRITCATMAHGSEPVHEPAHGKGVRRLVEPPATPPGEGEELVSMREVLKGTRWEWKPSADVPPSGEGAGRPHLGFEQAREAQARLDALRGGRLYA